MPSTSTDRLNGLTTSVAVKAPCLVATTANITLFGTQTIDGVAVVSGDRVLVKDQTSAVDNGIYVVTAAGWTRAPDFDGSLDATGGTQIYVTSGTANPNSYWRVTGTDTTIVIGTDSVSFAAAGLSDSAAHTFLQAGTGAKARGVQSKLREIEVSLVDFQNDDGTTPVGNGVMDCSTAWQRLLTHCNTVAFAALLTGYPITTATATVPAGDWLISTGATISVPNLVIEGKSKSATRIRIGSGQYLVTATDTIRQFELRGVSTSGGAGVFAHTGTGVSVQSVVVIEHNNFHDYTVAAISSLASDNPYWNIVHNEFRGAAAMTSKAIALKGARDMSLIAHNAFLWDLYHIKLGNGANEVKIRDNDFIRYGVGGGAPILTDIWIVPHTAADNSGFGCEITGNKFGNENLSVGDYRILVADEGAGTDFRDKNHATTASTGYWSGASVEDNVFVGDAGITRGAIYSYTPRVRNGIFINKIMGTKPPYVIEYDAGVSFSAENRLEDTNIAGWSQINEGQESYTGPVSSQPSTCLPYDPHGLMQAQSNSVKPWTSGFDVSFVDILATNDMTAASTASASISGVADAIGGDNAVEATYSASNGEVYITLTAGNMTVGRNAFIEFDIKAGTSQALTRLEASIRTDAAAIAERLIINVPSYWITMRLPWVPRQTATTLRLKFLPGTGAYSGGVTDKVRIGRPRLYHAHEPVHPGARFLEAKATYDPGSLADGAGVTTTVTVDGAALGDFALASFSLALQDISVTAWVSAADTVSVRFQNESTGVVDLASGTLRARVYKLAAP